ncbi:MAG: phosphopantetheine--protein transferase [Pedosphaera sp.]|nr:phosphopantetheine--protein transferase [Pedosphaera sp.]
MKNLELNWPRPSSAEWSLGTREVHVWAASLLTAPQRAAAFALTLSPDEQTRAGRFLFDRDRSRFVAGRGLLRSILGPYLRQEPGQIKFDYAERGKPSLACQTEKEGLHFNLAHSEDLAVFAVCKVCPVGVDVERLRPMKDAEDIAERFFSARETAQLKSLPAEQKQAGFFNLWTRKEAWLKATGEGICEMLGEVEVSMLPGEPARLLSIFKDVRAAAKWTMHDFNPAAGFKAALAVPCPGLQIQCRSWSDETFPNLAGDSP